MQVEVWSDVVCPWCYIGKRRLESALEQFPHRDQVEVVWRSFQLDPSVPEGETHPTLPALAAKYGTSVEQMRANMAHVEQTAA
ncbi:MAG TPA: DsbA family protein, partial [Blastococcus sp.]|nr:DsbA family protein [Blastococcus sp.]